MAKGGPATAQQSCVRRQRLAVAVAAVLATVFALPSCFTSDLWRHPDAIWHRERVDGDIQAASAAVGDSAPQLRLYLPRSGLPATWEPLGEATGEWLELSPTTADAGFDDLAQSICARRATQPRCGVTFEIPYVPAWVHLEARVPAPPGEPKLAEFEATCAWRWCDGPPPGAVPMTGAVRATGWVRVGVWQQVALTPVAVVADIATLPLQLLVWVTIGYPF